MTPEEQQQNAELDSKMITKLNKWLEGLPTWLVLVVVVLLTLMKYGRALACVGLAALYWHEGKTDIAAIWAIIAVIMLPAEKAKGATK